ncbi:MAG: hypothetical protein ACT4PT_10530, partial [Methanobacteriota archaeon]
AGVLRWRFARETSSKLNHPGLPAPPPPAVCDAEASGPACASAIGDVVLGFAVVGETVVATTVHVNLAVFLTRETCALADSPVSLPGTTAPGALALSATDGHLLWNLPGQTEEGANSDQMFVQSPSFLPTGAGTVAYVKIPRFMALNTERGNEVWSSRIGAEDSVRVDVGSGFGLVGTSLFVTSNQNMYRFDTSTQTQTGTTLGLTGDEYWGSSGLIVADGVLYARSVTTSAVRKISICPVVSQATSLRAYDVTTPEMAQLWNTSLPGGIVQIGRIMEFAVGDGVAVMAHASGLVRVVGTTAASLRPVASTSGTYPAPGARVAVDLSGSSAGAFGPPTRFRADWGDGARTEWLREPELAHAYLEPGDREARFEVANDAGQTASMPVTFHVGAPEPNLLSSAFARENQDATFFVLGLTITLVAAAFGFARLQRNQRLLRRELAAVAAGVELTRERPPECEALLAERKARAHGLLLDGKLTDAQFGVLERRIDQLAREVRLGRLDERFDFLPHGIVKMLTGMLEDGRIADWEHRVVVEALEKDRNLSSEEKAKVRALIDDWFARDSGGRDASP